MAILVHDCPRCASRSVVFEFLAETKQSSAGVCYAVFVCPKCNGPITAQLVRADDGKIQWQGDIRDAPDTAVVRIEPKHNVSDVPANVPKAVAYLYEEACYSLYQKAFTGAAATFRKCLELALREFAPGIEAWKLEKRIDKMAQDRLITPALQTWAHELRLDGNEALHGDQAPPADLVHSMERLSYYLLTYLYTLPWQVEIARELRRSNDKTIHAASCSETAG